jgi:hypothetical protein
VPSLTSTKAKDLLSRIVRTQPLTVTPGRSSLGGVRDSDLMVVSAIENTLSVNLKLIIVRPSRNVKDFHVQKGKPGESLFPFVEVLIRHLRQPKNIENGA